MTTRRKFFTMSSAALSIGASRILGANERVNMAVIGLGGRGTAHMNEYVKLADEANIVALVDVNQAAQERGAALVSRGNGGRTPKTYRDMREVFRDKSVDAVSMATPNHWHALGTVWACQAGKDVYVEKPACHNIWEGAKMIEAARKYKRMVQIGSQSRSLPHVQKGMRMLKDGAIGELYASKGLCYKRRKSIGKTPELVTPPAGIDWDFFLGPAPMRKFTQNRFAYNWHWFWDTGNGDLGNQGVHQMDVARWGLGDIKFPKSVVSTGGKFLYDDDQETPNTQHCVFDYGNGKQIEFEVRGLITGEEGGVSRRGGNTVGDLFYGSDGWMALDGAGFTIYKGEKGEKSLEEKANRESDTGNHMKNFLDAVRGRDNNKLNAEVEIGVISASLCHLANISYRLGRKLELDAENWRFKDADANKMLTREYRKPYVVPDRV